MAFVWAPKHRASGRAARLLRRRRWRRGRAKMILLEPFYFTFMLKAFLIAAIVAVLTALLSCFLVLRAGR